MPVDVHIKNGVGVSGEITKDGEQIVTVSPYPAIRQQKVQPFRQYFTVDGTAAGSNDMGVDGSVTNVDFYIDSSNEYDRYITTLNFIVAYGASGAPFQWADGTALTNGMRLFYENLRGESEIHDGIKSNQDMFRLASDAVTSLWEVRGVNAINDYGYFLTLDFRKFGFPYGLKLDTGTKQRLVMTVRDNAGTDADTFNCIAYGFDRFE